MLKCLFKCLASGALSMVVTSSVQANAASSAKTVQLFPNLNTAKLSHHMMKRLESGAVHHEVIIKLAEKADLSQVSSALTKEKKGRAVYRALTEVAKASQAKLVKYLSSKNVRFERFYISNMIAAYGVSNEVLSELTRRVDVYQIFGNQSYSVDIPVSVAPFEQAFEAAGIEKSLVETNTIQVWEQYGLKGKGIVVAGQDTGVQWDHPALIRQYRGYADGGAVDHNYHWYDAIREPLGSSRRNPCGYATEAPCDDNNHGTHTVGTIVGDDGRGNQIGMAPEAEWIACRNMDSGMGRSTTYMRCFEFFLAPFPLNGDPMEEGRPELAPHVINNSWGCPVSELCEGNELADVLEAIYRAGIINVVSAGNAGSNCGSINDQPATHSDLTLSVGAYDHRSGRIAYFSSRGPSALDGKVGPDVAAPGVRIRSAVTGSRYQGGFSGTSMAGPHVAGQAALVLEALGGAYEDTQTIFDLITASARAKTHSQTCGGVSGDSIPNNTFGYGNIDSLSAVEMAIKTLKRR